MRYACVFTLFAALTSSAYGQATKASYVAQGSFQLPAKGQPGSPQRPAALAAAPDGSIHLADGRGMVIVFEANGVYRRAYGRERLRRPVAIEIAPTGEAFVLDADLDQVLVFAPGGQPLRSISAKGGRGGFLSDPVDMAMGPSGYVYVVDRGLAGVQIFSQDGVFVRDIRPGDVIREPLAVTVGLDGVVFVSDGRTETNIFSYPPFTELPWNTAVPRGVAGQVVFRGAGFDEPAAMATNEYGTVVVLDKKAGRVWRRNTMAEAEPGPNDVLYGGSGTGRGSFRDAVDVAFAGPDELLILDAQLRKVERIRLTTESDLGGTRPPFDFPFRVTRGARALPAPLINVGYTADGGTLLAMRGDRGSLRVVGTNAELYATAYGDSVPAFLPNPRVLRLSLSQDIGEAVAAELTDSTAVVLDSRRNRFAIFSLADGTLLGTFGDNYRDNRKLRDPNGLAMFPDGRIVIGDTGNDRIKIFSPDLASLVASFPIAKPAGVAVTPAGDIYTWNQQGTIISRLPARGDRFEPLRADLIPTPIASITFDEAGNLFALHRTTHRVTIVQSDLSKVLLQLGTERGLTRPDRITVDHDGNIYISDPGAKRTAVYRWDVAFPPLARLDLSYQDEGAVLEWPPGPEGYVVAYDIQGSRERNSGYTLIERVASSPYRLEASRLGQPRPRWIRVAPVFITGVTGKGTDPYPLFNVTAEAAFRRGAYAEALRDASQAVELINQGALEADDDIRGELLWLAFASATQLGDYRASINWAQQLAQVPIPRDRLIQFRYRLAEIYLQLGNAQEASQHVLAVVAAGPDAEFFRDPAVVDQSFRVYRGMADAGFIEDGIEFLRMYSESIPTRVPDMQAMYADSIAVYKTRAKLGPGFRFWNSASFADAVNFFERLLTSAGLTIEEQVVSRQILAAAYYAFGRRSEAEDTYREIFSIRPDFDLRTEVARLRRVYGLTVYNPETQRFFGAIRPRS